MYKWLIVFLLMLGLSLPLAAQQPSNIKKDIDPNAMAALDKMGAYLRTLNTFQVRALETSDDVLDNGQAVQSGRVINLLAARPNRLFVEIDGDDMDRFFLYDGKNFTIYGRLVNYYATVPAPPTIAELIDKIGEKYDIEFPLVDLFLWGSPQSTTAQDITSAIDLGPGSVEGTTCEQYAFRQDGLDWQIWIQQGNYPLPRKLVLVTLTDPARPRSSQVLAWNLAPSFNDAIFTFDPPEGAHRITITEVNAAVADEQKASGGVQ